MQYYFLFAFAALLIGTGQCQKKADDNPLNQLLYSWKVNEYKYLEISAMSDAEIKRLSQKTMFFEEHKAVIFDRAFSNPKYQIQDIDTDSFLVRQFSIKGKDIGLNAQRSYLI